ncbi:30S ribosome-binding factor RbfA [Salinisphaera sp. T31B1]|uniref:30S ribosome-binding factor RbfA n=1 Tax=Salinisphaera sp. T31B1 TaxID=727963 RepID=UPI00333EF02B
MPREFTRRHRVAEELKRELGILLTTEVKDPRVRLVAITDVEVSPDLKYAKVYVGSFDVTASADPVPDMLDGLRAARGFLKRALGKRMHLRVMPELRFIEDATEREAHRLESVIKAAVDADREHAGDPEDASQDLPSSSGHGPT